MTRFITVPAVIIGLILAPMTTKAAVPSDYGLKEGDTISAKGSSDPDVYIVNALGYKRLFLNPVIFSFYGHLGGFAAVKSVSAAARDAFPTSGLFRNCETNDQKVYGVEVNGEDTGMFHWVNVDGATAVSQDANFFKKVFCINNNEFNWYPKSAIDYTSLSQIPVYSRVNATPTPTPNPSPTVSPTPSPTPTPQVEPVAQSIFPSTVKVGQFFSINGINFKINDINQVQTVKIGQWSMNFSTQNALSILTSMQVKAYGYFDVIIISLDGTVSTLSNVLQVIP